MVELRKRKTPPPSSTSQPPALKKAASKSSVKSNVSTQSAKAASQSGANGSTPKSSSQGKIEVGQTLDLERFGGEVETHDGVKVTFKGILDEAKGDVVVFTYPKASTPGCTTQASLFSTAHPILSSPPHNLTIYGLSTDSPRANTTFKIKQNLPYTLLCDPSATLIAALGLKKSPKGTTRGVVVLSKSGEVKLWEAAGPAATVEAVQQMYPAGASNGSGGDAGDADTADKEGGVEGDVAAAVNSSDGLNTVESNVEKEIEAGKMDAQEADQDTKMGEARVEKPSEVAAQVADSAKMIDGAGSSAGAEGDGVGGEKQGGEGEKPSDVAAQVANSAEMIDGDK